MVYSRYQHLPHQVLPRALTSVHVQISAVQSHESIVESQQCYTPESKRSNLDQVGNPSDHGYEDKDAKEHYNLRTLQTSLLGTRVP